MLLHEVREQLCTNILPFWKSLKDEENGGYYGYYSYGLELDKKAVKGGILNSRILWFFSNAHTVLGNPEDLVFAKHAYEFLREFCIDHTYGGVFWSVNYKGKPVDTTKYTYNQAFAIYALSSYYGESKETNALTLAYELYEVIENKCKDEIGYLEAFDCTFQPIENVKLSENGLLASRTYNTLLHVFEAYTELYRVTKNIKVGNAMRGILDQFVGLLYNKEYRMMEVFFDEKMKSISDLHSYGHDIETAWLLDRGIEILGDEEYIQKVRPITQALAACIYEVAFDGHSLNNEKIGETVNTSKIWWVQAEAVVGFLNAYEKNPTRKEYLKAAKEIWDFIKTYLIDKRENSEWLYEVNSEGVPNKEKEIAGPWKCPYHNGRMCFEVLRRLQ